MVTISGGVAEGGDDLIRAALDVLCHLRCGRTHVRIVIALASSSNRGCKHQRQTPRVGRALIQRVLSLGQHSFRNGAGVEHDEELAGNGPVHLPQAWLCLGSLSQ